MRTQQQDSLLAEFVGTFGGFNELWEYADIYPIVAELAVGETDELGQTHWQPAKVETDIAALDPLYAKLPGRFPPLYERLMLTYRWAEVDLGRYTLRANPPGRDLQRLLNEISKDPAIWESLVPAGYIQFARGADHDYDPVCFDVRERKKGRDYRIVKIDHEAILCNYKVKVIAELASSFEDLVRQTISELKKAGTGSGAR